MFLKTWQVVCKFRVQILRECHDPCVRVCVCVLEGFTKDISQAYIGLGRGLVRAPSKRFYYQNCLELGWGCVEPHISHFAKFTLKNWYKFFTAREKLVPMRHTFHTNISHFEKFAHVV